MMLMVGDNSYQDQQMPVKDKLLSCWVAVIAVLSGLATGEEFSILEGCQMSAISLDSSFNLGPDAICDGGFKSKAIYASTSSTKEFILKLKQSKKIVSSFVCNTAEHGETPPRMGTSAIYVGNDRTVAFSTSLIKCTDYFFDTGFYSLGAGCQGDTIAVRRTAGSSGFYDINEVRLYETPNLLVELNYQVTISGPAPTNSTYAVTNLITHLSSRSSGNSLKPILTPDPSLTRATYESCFKTSNIQLSTEGNKMVLTVNLGGVYFQHAILVVQDIFGGIFADNMNNQLNYLQNFEIYVGNDSDRTKNKRCSRGPFLRVNDPLSYVNVTKTSSGGAPGAMWKFGEEVWCNLEGQYMIFVADLNHLSGQQYLMTICSLAIFGTRYKRGTPVPTALIVFISQTYTLDVEKITADSTLAIGNTLDIRLRQAGTQLDWVTFTNEASLTKVSFSPSIGVQPGDYTIALESFDQAGGVFSTLKTDTVAVKVLPSECRQQLSHKFDSQSTIEVILEYESTLFFPEVLFQGPHTFTAFACGGTYTQTITVDVPVSGVVLIDRPGGSDLRPRIEFGPSAPAGTTFSVTFSGRYSYAPFAVEITASFSQTYRLKTVFSTDYIEQPTITHSLKPADLTFNVPPAAVGATATPQFLAASLFSVEYPIKTGTTDTLGNTPPAIAPVPYAGFAATDFTKGQLSLGTTKLSMPRGVLAVQGSGFNGNLAAGSIQFACDAWTLARQGTSASMTLSFVNSAVSAFKASLSVLCSYQTSTAPYFASALPSIVLTASVAQTWTLPAVVQGSFPLKRIKFEPELSLARFLSFDEVARTVRFDGNPSIAGLFATQLKVVVTLVSEQGNESLFEQSVSICPVTSSDVDALVGLLTSEPLSLSLTAGKVASTQVDYRDKYDKIVAHLNYNDQKQRLCGAVTFELATKHSFLKHQPESKSLSVTADQATGPANYEDSYLLVTVSSYSFKIPVRVEFSSCLVARLSFELSMVGLVYQVGSGSEQLDLPRLIQKPDCGSLFEKLFIKTIESKGISPQIVQTAVKLDLLRRAIVVTTFDNLFIGKNATLTVAAEAAGVEQKSDLQVQIQFSGATEPADTKQNQTNSLSALPQSNSNVLPTSSTVASAPPTGGPEKVVILEVAKNLSAELGIPGLVVPPVTAEQAAIVQTPATELSEEQLFAAVPLAARLTGGVKNLEELVTRQRDAFNSKVAELMAQQKPLPPEVRFEKFSNFGELKLSFTQKINFPGDLDQAIREANSPNRLLATDELNRARSAISIFAIKGGDPEEYDSDEPILKHWELLSLRPEGITFKVHFFKPLHVSTDETPDLLIVQLQLGEYLDGNGNSLPQAVLKKYNIPSQFGTETEANTVYNVGETFEAGSYSAIVFNFLVNLLISGSLTPVWSLVNSLQVVQMNRLFNIISPGNVNSFTSFVQNVASIQLLNDLSQLAVNAMLILPEQDPFSPRFMDAGHESKFFIVNVQQQLLLLAVFLALGILVAVLWPLAQCCQKVYLLRQRLAKSLFWNGFIRLVMQSFAEVILFAMLNLYAKDWPAGRDAVKADIVVTCVVLTTYALFPTVLLWVVWKKYQRHVETNTAFVERIGSFLVGTSRSELAKRSVLLYTLTFYVRRLTLAFSLILWHDFFWGQIAVQFAFATFIVILLQLGRPLETPYANHRETFNEYVTLHVLYLLMTFTHFVPKPETRNSLGVVYIVEISLFVAVHLALITWSKGRDTKMWLRRRFARKRAQSISRARQARLKQPLSEHLNQVVALGSVPPSVGSIRADSNLGMSEASDCQLIEDRPNVRSKAQSRRPRITVMDEEPRKTRAEGSSALKLPAMAGKDLDEGEQAAASNEKYFQQRCTDALTNNEIAWLKSQVAKEKLRQGATQPHEERFDERQRDFGMRWPVEVENEFWPQQTDPCTTTQALVKMGAAFGQKHQQLSKSAAAQQQQSSEAPSTQSLPNNDDYSVNQALSPKRRPTFPMKVLPQKYGAAEDQNPNFTLE